MPTLIQVKRGTASSWASINPVLSLGEFGYETDTKRVKIGDGATAWTSLPFWGTGSFTTPVGNGSSTTITVTHNLNTRNVLVSVKDSSSYAEVDCDVAATTVNTITLTFATAPTAGQYFATVIAEGAAITNSNNVTFIDTAFALKDDVDPTKLLKFDTAGISTGTTRTLAAPNANTTIVGTDASQVLTNKTISGSSNTISNISVSSLAATGTASSSTYLRGDGSWASSSGISTGKAIAMAMVFG